MSDCQGLCVTVKLFSFIGNLLICQIGTDDILVAHNRFI